MDHSNGEVYLDFRRKNIHPNTFEMLKNLCPEEDIRRTLTNIQNKRGLVQSKAQQLAIRLLQIMIRDDWEHENEIVDTSQNEHNQIEREDLNQEETEEGWADCPEENSNQNPTQDLTLSQMMAGERRSKEDTNLSLSQQPSTSRTADQLNGRGQQRTINPIPSTSRGQENSSRGINTEQTGSEKWDKNTPVCKFYKMDTCKFGKKCRNPHPKFCKKFMTQGSQKFSPMGCDSKCGKAHPSTCRNALRNNECGVGECKYYHMKSTNRNQRCQGPVPISNPNHTSRVNQNNQAQTEINTNLWEHKQREQELQKTRDQVFMDAQSTMMEMIQRLNVQMINMQVSMTRNQGGGQEPWYQQNPQQQPQDQYQPWQPQGQNRTQDNQSQQNQLQHNQQGWNQQPQQIQQQPQPQRGF